MNTSELVAGLDQEIARLQKVRALLSEASAIKPPKNPRTAGKKKRKGGMSAEGRARIAAVQKARWAKLRGRARNKG
jgi:hypothetical protein